MPFSATKLVRFCLIFPQEPLWVFCLQTMFLENCNIKSKAKNLLLLLSRIYSCYYTCAILNFIWGHVDYSHIEEFNGLQQQDVKSGQLLLLSDRYNQGNISQTEPVKSMHFCEKDSSDNIDSRL